MLAETAFVAAIHAAPIPFPVAVVVEISSAIAEDADLGLAIAVPVARRREIARLTKAVIQALVQSAVLLATIPFAVTVVVEVPGARPEYPNACFQSAIPVTLNWPIAKLAEVQTEVGACLLYTSRCV